MDATTRDFVVLAPVSQTGARTYPQSLTAKAYEDLHLKPGAGPAATPAPGRLRAGLHWLEFTTRTSLADTMALTTGVLYGIDLDAAPDLMIDMPGAPMGYEKQKLGPFGTRICYTPGRSDIHVIVPGKACEHAGTNAIIDLATRAPHKVTRIDGCIDGVYKANAMVNPWWLYDMSIHQPQKLRTRVKLNAEPDANGRRPENNQMVFGPNGDTWYLGSKCAERFMRTYTRRGYCRMEPVLRGAKAQAAADCLDYIREKKLPETVIGFIRGHVDFIEDNSVNKNNCKLQPWWEEVTEDAKKNALPIEREKTSAEKAWNWIKSVSATLQMVVEAGRTDWEQIAAMIARQSAESWSAKHEAIVKEAIMRGWKPTIDNTPEQKTGRGARKTTCAN